MPPLSYTWLTFAELRAALAQRLADPTNKFWADIENGLYINEALSTWNALTGTWQVDFVFNTDSRIWYPVPLLAGSPRARTVMDSQLYTVIEYHLLEPATGSTWTGTSQFTLEDLTAALQGTQDEILQATGCNLANMSLNTTPGVRRTSLPTNVLEVRRARWVPTIGDNATLWRNDALASSYFQPLYLQTVGPPEEYNVMDGPPLTFNVNNAPNTAGVYDLIVALTGAIFTPPAATTLAIPNDWCWLAKWGALAELLGRDSEATDRLRAEYCLQRYKEGVALMQRSPWILYGSLDNVPVDTDSMYQMDSFATEWDSDPKSYPAIVTAGIDLVARTPVIPATSGVGLTVVGNAPLPLLDTDYVQVSQDMADAVLDYAQHIASFKQGGSEFTDTAELYRSFIEAATETNNRIANLGIFRDLQFEQGLRQDQNQERFNEPSNARTRVPARQGTS
jgi:hypothetical protein